MEKGRELRGVELTGELRGSIWRVSDTLDEFRKLSLSINANSILAFLIIATKPGITVSEVQKALGMQAGSTTKAVGMLSEYHRGGKKGLNLILSHEDAYDRRVRHLFLKPRGEDLWNAIVDILTNRDDG